MPRSSRKRARSCWIASPVRSRRRESAFELSSSYNRILNNSKDTDVPTLSSVEQSGSDRSCASSYSPDGSTDTSSGFSTPSKNVTTSLYLHVMNANITISGDRLHNSRAPENMDSAHKNGHGQHGGLNSSSLLVQPYTTPVGSAGNINGNDSEDEHPNKPKQPMRHSHDDTSSSSDNSERRNRHRNAMKGKRAWKAGSPGYDNASDIVYDSPNGLDSDSSHWMLDAPSPLPENEINNIPVRSSVLALTTSDIFGSSSKSVSTNLPDPRSDPYPDAVRARSKSEVENPVSYVSESNKPRRNSMIDAFAKKGHARVGTKFPNMALEGYGRACGMPTTAQLKFGDKRYTLVDDNGKKVVMNPAPIGHRISERSNSTPREAAFPGPSTRKQILAEAGKSSTAITLLPSDTVAITSDADAIDHLCRSRELVPDMPSNAAREESESRPGWRTSTLVPAHVITGEKIGEHRPLELKSKIFTNESGYGALSLLDDSSFITNPSLIERNNLSVHATEEMGDAPLLQAAEMSTTAQWPREYAPPITMVNETSPTAPRNASASSDRLNQGIMDLRLNSSPECSQRIPFAMSANEAIYDGPAAYHIETGHNSSPSRQPSSPILVTTAEALRNNTPSSSSPPEADSLFSTPPPEIEDIQAPENLPANQQYVAPPPPPSSATRTYSSGQTSASSDETCRGCGRSFMGFFNCLTCDIFRTPNPPVVDPLPRFSLTAPTRSNSPNVRLHGRFPWRPVGWRYRSSGSRTRNGTPHNRTNATSAETLELQQQRRRGLKSEEHAPSPKSAARQQG